MARTLTEIYTTAKELRDSYLENTEYSGKSNSSKMSILDAFTYTVSACIWVFECILNVFQVDIAKDLMNRVNGTALYFANAMLKFQYKAKSDTIDENIYSLTPSEDYSSFGYSETNEDAQVIKKVSYTEYSQENYYDKRLVLKVAGEDSDGDYRQLTTAELTSAQTYVKQIAFAGQDIQVASYKGDLLIPFVNVHYDGSVTEATLRANIEASLKTYCSDLDYDARIYKQKVIDAILHTDNVVDVSIESGDNIEQGIYMVQYNADETIANDGEAIEVSHYQIPNSGFVREADDDEQLQGFWNWDSAIVCTKEDEEDCLYNKTIQAPSASGLTYKLLSTELALSEDYCSVRIRIDYSGESTNIAQYDVTIGDTSKENAKYLTDSLTSITGSDEFEVSLDSLSSGEGIINLTATAIATTLTADTNDSAATDEDGSYVVRTSVWNNNVCTTTTTTYASYADYEENVNNWTIKVVSVITYADSEHTTIESIETTTQTKTSSGEDSESSTQQQEPEHDLIGEAFRISVIYVK